MAAVKPALYKLHLNTPQRDTCFDNKHKVANAIPLAIPKLAGRLRRAYVSECLSEGHNIPRVRPVRANPLPRGQGASVTRRKRVTGILRSSEPRDAADVMSRSEPHERRKPASKTRRLVTQKPQLTKSKKPEPNGPGFVLLKTD